MNRNNIHDALNMLDDSMIEAVDSLRNKPLKLRKEVVQLGSLVAILCLSFVGIIAFIPKSSTANDAGSVLYGYLEDNLSSGDKMKTESAVENSITGSSVCVIIMELMDDGFVAEVVENAEVLDGASSDKLTVVYTDSITDETVSGLKVGNIVDVTFSYGSKISGMIYAHSIRQSTDE